MLFGRVAVFSQVGPLGGCNSCVLGVTSGMVNNSIVDASLYDNYLESSCCCYCNVNQLDIPNGSHRQTLKFGTLVHYVLQVGFQDVEKNHPEPWGR